MTLLEVINARRVIESLADKEVNVGLAYRMNKFLLATQSDEDFYQSKLRELLGKYNATATNASVQIGSDFVEPFDKDVLELQSTEVEAPQTKFTFSELSEEFRLSMKQLRSLTPFIIDDVNEE